MAYLPKRKHIKSKKPKGTRSAGGFHETQNPNGLRAKDKRRHESK